MTAYRARAIEAIRAHVGDGKVICGLSGGVDSSVAAVLIYEAIGEQLTCVFVDHGLDGALQSSGIVTPQQLDRHRGGSSENAEVCPDWQSP